MTSQKNPWIRARHDADTAMIFIHGVNSAASSCWQSKTYFWPELVKRDERFSAFDIYAPDYFTGIGASDYGIADCAGELVRQLQTSSTPHGKSLLSYRNIIFIAHSFGGVIARYILESQRQRFSNKKVGLILMASPSHGSIFADFVRRITWPILHKQRDELSSSSPLLEDLDNRFKRLVHAKNLEFELIGIEAYEQSKIFGIKRIVSQRSATPYFGESVHIPRSSHSSIVKPDTQDHPSHKLLASFCEEHFQTQFLNTFRPEKNIADKINLLLFDVYHPDCSIYYFNRPIDNLVIKTSRFRSIWLHGDSGVGKTSIARMLFRLKIENTISIYLANCELPISKNLIEEISHTAKERNWIRGGHATEIKSLALELSNFGMKLGQLNILIDEIPIGLDSMENQLIFDRISHLVHEIKTINPSINVLIVMASINEPLVTAENCPGKFMESFQLIQVPKWHPDELQGLASLIESSKALPNIAEIARAAMISRPGTPRELKSKIRDALIQAMD